MQYVTELVIALAGMGMGMVGVVFFDFDAALPVSIVRRRWPATVTAIVSFLSLAAGLWFELSALRLMSVGLVLFAGALSVAGRRHEEKPTRVVLHRGLLSPGTGFERENVDARWVETRERLVFYIRDEDWNDIPAATKDTRLWMDQFVLAPGIYSTPSDNETLQLIDSLQLYRFLLSSDHDTAISEFVRLLNIRPAAIQTVPEVVPVSPVEFAKVPASAPPPSSEAVTGVAAPETTTEAQPRKRRAKLKVSKGASQPVEPGQELFFGPPPQAQATTSTTEPPSAT